MTENEEFIDFYKPELDRQRLKSLVRRTDGHGLLQIFTWLGACILSGAWVVLAMYSFWLIPALFTHGLLLSFSYAASHECAHGTAFRTRWINEAVFWFTSLVFGEEPVYRRYSHTSHHSYTWFPGRDAQMPYSNPVSIRKYLMETSGILFFLESPLLLLRHSLGRISNDVKEFVPESEIPVMRRNSVIFLAIYGSLLASVFVFNTILPLLLYFIPRILGGWVINLYINTQHMCMQEGIADHRYTTRSITCNRLSRWLYWNMNFHIEHHIFPMVPFHALPELNKQISSELPVPYRGGVFGANLQIVKLIFRQKHEPNAAVTPVFRN